MIDATLIGSVGVALLLGAFLLNLLKMIRTALAAGFALARKALK